jgi:L-amino acid N-acyltransferase YncA
MHVRLATIEDSERIREIYNLEVETNVVNFDLRPRTSEDQRRWLIDRSGAHAVIVAETESSDPEQGVAGFASLSPYRPKPAYNTSVENSIYIDRNHQGEGVGSLLLGELCRLSDTHGFHAMFARIVGNHEASRALHHKHGFELVGIEREVGRKFGRWLDVALMQRLAASS